jgi:hypothetical protein
MFLLHRSYDTPRVQGTERWLAKPHLCAQMMLAVTCGSPLTNYSQMSDHVNKAGLELLQFACDVETDGSNSVKRPKRTIISIRIG